MKAYILILAMTIIGFPAFSQYRKIKESDILYKQRIVRAIHLKNTSNENLFGSGNTLALVLIEAFQKGELVGFKNDDLKEILSYADFAKKMAVPLDEGDTLSYAAHDLSYAEISEDLIFDKHRSEIVLDIESITLFLPEDNNTRSLLEPVISFQYDDCVQLFKKDLRAVAFNPLLNGRNINYSEVFTLRLFHSNIVKIGNENYFDQMYSDPTMAFLARKEAENKLTEYLFKLVNPD